MRSLPRFIDAFFVVKHPSAWRSTRRWLGRGMLAGGLLCVCLPLLAWSQESLDARVAPPAGSPTAGLELPASGQARVVLLKNDRCLTGVVRQLGDQVIIEIDQNARISISLSEVQTVADDMEAAYRFKLSRYPNARLGPGEHIRMARWSMSNGLHEHAARHFLAVNREAGQNPIVRQLGIELREQLLRDEGFRRYLGLESLATTAPAQAEVRPAYTAAPEPPQAPILPVVLTAFADHVQPILLRRCAQSGCHGFSSSNRLKFVQPSGNARARISEQNCRSALQFVEVDGSHMSTLLRYSVVAHGLQKTPAITAQEKNLSETLESWTTFARNPVMAAVPATPGNSAGQAGGAAATAPAVFSGEPTGSAGPAPLAPLNSSATPLSPTPLSPGSPPGVNGPVIKPGSSQVTDREIDQLDDMVRQALGEPARGRSLDPFDPAEFNRRAVGNQK